MFLSFVIRHRGTRYSGVLPSETRERLTIYRGDDERLSSRSKAHVGRPGASSKPQQQSAAAFDHTLRSVSRHWRKKKSRRKPTKRVNDLGSAVLDGVQWLFRTLQRSRLPPGSEDSSRTGRQCLVWAPLGRLAAVATTTVVIRDGVVDWRGWTPIAQTAAADNSSALVMVISSVEYF